MLLGCFLLVVSRQMKGRLSSCTGLIMDATIRPHAPTDVRPLRSKMFTAPVPPAKSLRGTVFLLLLI